MIEWILSISLQNEIVCVLENNSSLISFDSLEFASIIFKLKKCLFGTRATNECTLFESQSNGSDTSMNSVLAT